MKKLFILLKGNLDLAKEEVLALSRTKKFHFSGNFLVINTEFDFSRLAYTKSVYNILIQCTKKQLIKKLKDFDWQKVYKKSFCVRLFNEKKEKEKDYAEYIWESLRNPKVDLKNPGTEIHIFFTGKKVFVCLKINTKKSDYEKRRAHLREKMHPSSLHPKLARAMVNLTGIKKGKITDPFCGTGGILLEAALLGFRIEGYDIDQMMLDMAEANLKRFNPKIEKKDATEIRQKIDYVVSDLPYGKATRSQNLTELYTKFFIVLKKYLGKKAVIGLPDFIDNKSLIRKSGLKIRKEFTVYLHKSLSKKIFVIVK